MTGDKVKAIVQAVPRSVKILCDAGKADSIEDGRALFDRSRVLIVPPEHADRSDIQMAILTTVALARRTFVNHVKVANSAGLDAKVSGGPTLRALITGQGCGVTDSPNDFAGQVLIGNASPFRGIEASVRPIFTGWRGGVAPGCSTIPELPGNVVSVALAAGLAVNEMFNRLLLDDLYATERTFGFSLWDLAQGWTADNAPGLRIWRRDELKWMADPGNDPAIEMMPKEAWFAGLGHLGQAYLWVMGALVCFGRPKGKPTFLLQDIGNVKKSTYSTSVLTPEETFLGMPKTRVCARAIERLGVQTDIVERKFGFGYRVGEDEPKLAFGGFDNLLARRAWSNCPNTDNFIRIIDAGLGAYENNFGLVTIYTLPDNDKSPKDIWQEREHFWNKPNPKAVYIRDLDECGQIQVANRPVGIPCVGMVAAAFAVSEALRALHGGNEYQAIQLDLKNPDSMSFHARKQGLEKNPGFLWLRRTP